MGNSMHGLVARVMCGFCCGSEKVFAF